MIRFGHDYDPTCMLMDEVGRRPPEWSFFLGEKLSFSTHNLALTATRRPSLPAGTFRGGREDEELCGHLRRGHHRGAEKTRNKAAIFFVFLAHTLLCGSHLTHKTFIAVP